MLMDDKHVYTCSSSLVRVLTLTSLQQLTSFKLPHFCVPRRVVCVAGRYHITTADPLLLTVSRRGVCKEHHLAYTPVDLQRWGQDAVVVCFEGGFSLFHSSSRRFEKLLLPHSFCTTHKALKGLNQEFYSVYSTSHAIGNHSPIKVVRVAGHTATEPLQLNHFHASDLRLMTSSGGLLYVLKQQEGKVYVYGKSLVLLYHFPIHLHTSHAVVQVGDC